MKPKKETISILTDEDRKLITEFNRNISWLKHQSREESKTKWVRVTQIQAVTGWDREAMRRARLNGLVKFKKDKDTGMWYDIESIHHLILKQKIPA